MSPLPLPAPQALPGVHISRGRVRRLALLAAAAVAVGLSVPASAGAPAPTPGDPDGPVTLGGAVTASSSETAVIRVRVPQRTTLALTGITLRGGDGFTGVLLTEPRSRDGFFVEQVRYPADATGRRHLADSGQLARADRASGTVVTPATISCRTCTVPAGDYDLYVIADGAPTTVSFTLEGLPGLTTLDDSDLTVVPSTRVSYASKTTTFGTLAGGSDETTDCCFASSGGLAYSAFRSAVQTQSLSDVDVTFCLINPSGACTGGSSGISTIGALGPDDSTSYPTAVVAPGQVGTSLTTSVRSGTSTTVTTQSDTLLLDWQPPRG